VSASLSLCCPVLGRHMTHAPLEETKEGRREDRRGLQGGREANLICGKFINDLTALHPIKVTLPTF
jgi:hypothetical protein